MRAIRSGLIPCVACLSIQTGCHVSHGCEECSTTVVLVEQEPNDWAAVANFAGFLSPGDRFEIHGHVAEWGPDLFDGFAFVTAEPCHVEVRLWIEDPSADLDLCLYDPQVGGFAFCFETSANPEAGSFEILQAGKEFHLVVTSFVGASAYRLDVEAFEPLPIPAAGGSQPGPAGWRATSPSTPGLRRDRSAYAARGPAHEPPLPEVVSFVPGLLIDPQSGATRRVWIHEAARR
jgi:hypothetical protein